MGRILGGETMKMSNARYDELWDSDLPLTQEEKDAGYHFCFDWDGLLVGPGTMEWDGCTCGITPKEAT